MSDQHGEGRYATTVVSGVVYRFEDFGEAKAFCKKAARGNRVEVGLHDLEDREAGALGVWDENGDQVE